MQTASGTELRASPDLGNGGVGLREPWGGGRRWRLGRLQGVKGVFGGGLSGGAELTGGEVWLWGSRASPWGVWRERREWCGL